MAELEKYVDLWTTDKEKYYICMSDDNFCIMNKNNMMLLIEEENVVNYKIIKSMIENNVKVFKYDSQTRDKTYVSPDEALRKLEIVSTKNVKVKIVWNKDVPISRQILQLKKISSELSHIQSSQLFKMIDMQEKEWVFCETTLEEAVRLKNVAMCQGIQLEIVGII